MTGDRLHRERLQDLLVDCSVVLNELLGVFRKFLVDWLITGERKGKEFLPVFGVLFIVDYLLWVYMILNNFFASVYLTCFRKGYFNFKLWKLDLYVLIY